MAAAWRKIRRRGNADRRLKREIKEELSVEIKPESIFDTFVFKSASGANHFAVIYICEMVSDFNDIKIDSENQKFK